MSKLISTTKSGDAFEKKPRQPATMNLEQYRMLKSQPAAPAAQAGRSSKYNAKKTEVDGIVFDSIGESKRYLELRLLQQIGEIYGLKLQQSHRLIIDDVLICTYKSDFEYFKASGEYVVEDFKGFRTPEYKIKRNLMKALMGVTIYETGAKKTNKGAR
jgi:hypothetical protein